jgi:glucuronate isomerase
VTSPVISPSADTDATRNRRSRLGLRLDPDRLLPVDPGVRALARQFYESTRSLPIVSPHGHVDANVLAHDISFGNAADLLITPDHYVTRLLHAHGVPFTGLGHPDRVSGTPTVSGREVWRSFCENWKVFRGTPSRLWLEAELVDVFGLDLAPDASTADELYDAITERLALPEFKPRALFDRFNIEVLATTDEPADDLAAHRLLAQDPDFHGRVLPTFRPDRYLDPSSPTWTEALERLAASTGRDTGTYPGYLAALEERRAYFKAHGATATDSGHPDAACRHLSVEEASTMYASLVSGTGGPAAVAAFRGHMLFEMARMSSEDGLVMQLHPGVVRNYDKAAFASFGADTGHDIPTTAEFTHSLRPILEEFGNSSTFRIVVFTVDETVFSRELAPLAGYFPAMYVGAPWWFIDTPDAIGRFRAAVTDTAGFYKTSGFIDDTRAFCSIPARHDMSRRLDAAYLARLVAEGRLSEDEGADTAVDLVHSLPRQVFRL